MFASVLCLNCRGLNLFCVYGLLFEFLLRDSVVVAYSRCFVVFPLCCLNSIVLWVICVYYCSFFVLPLILLF